MTELDLIQDVESLVDDAAAVGADEMAELVALLSALHEAARTRHNGMISRLEGSVARALEIEDRSRRMFAALVEEHDV